MKFVVTGSLGNISKPLAEKLIAAGHDVTIVSSKANKAEQIEALGAKAAIGSVEDIGFLTKTFSGVDAVLKRFLQVKNRELWKSTLQKVVPTGSIHFECLKLF